MNDAVLVADELVANAVRYGGGCLRLQIHARGGRATIADVDGCAVVPRRREPDPRRRPGLAITEALCDEWGVTVLDDGHKCVWVRLAPPPVGDEPPGKSPEPWFAAGGQARRPGADQSGSPPVLPARIRASTSVGSAA
ncbi:ATP-binding protein [Micromonospora sp. DR5-3]|uniref:ATP-binding protein n=1 Tax=unclassified Micromonospora TaxID=2617518 RepID=UPI0016521AB4|nr:MULTISPECIES: ATP-binding protein [unclassified Micromonospora]MCW3817922.1 ATP-binding protein [Micromonospora sp. DR5-3]